MRLPATVEWLLTGLFLLIAFFCLRRLTKFDHGRADRAMREHDLLELLLVVVMAAMVSPFGGPIPVAGWQAVLALIVAWCIGISWQRWRKHRTGSLSILASQSYHAISAAAMLYLFAAMPHGEIHSPWLNMGDVDLDGEVTFPVAIVLIGYFLTDAVWVGIRALRAKQWLDRPHFPRLLGRGIMGLGMAFMFIGGL